MSRSVPRGPIRRFVLPFPRARDASADALQLRILLLGGIVIAALFGFFSLLIVNDGTVFVPVVSFISLAIFLLLFLFTYLDLLMPARIGLIAAIYTAATAGMVLESGVAAAVVSVYAVVLLLTAVLLGRRAALVMGGLIASTLLVAFLLEWLGLLFPLYPVQATTAHLTYSYIVMILAVCLQTLLLVTIVGQLVNRSGQMANQADSLQSQNVRLAEAQLSLKRQTDELAQTNHRLQQEMQQRRVAETALIEAQKLESLGLLAGGIAHDFNNLLTGVISQGELALLKLDGEHPAKRNIQKSLNSAQNAADLTRQLLTYAGRGKIEPEILDLNDVIKGTREIIENGLHTGVRVDYQLGEGVASVHMDRAQLQQILMNLVLNAADAVAEADTALAAADDPAATPMDTVDLDDAHVTVATFNLRIDDLEAESYACAPEEGGDFVCLDVSDRGHGINANTLTRIFDPFYSTKESGHGLGLSAVMGIVRSVGGALKVESQPGQGTRFLIMLRAYDGEDGAPSAVAAPTREADARSSAPLDGRTILVIDDDDHVRMTAVDILQMSGAETLSADGGREGVRLFQAEQTRIDAVLLDVRMPEMDGPTVLRYLRGIAPDLPVVLASGYAERTDVSALVQPGEVVFLAKPYSVDQLVNVLYSLLTS